MNVMALTRHRFNRFCFYNTYLHVILTELPSGTITSDEVSSDIKSGGITTSK